MVAHPSPALAIPPLGLLILTASFLWMLAWRPAAHFTAAGQRPKPNRAAVFFSAVPDPHPLFFSPLSFPPFLLSLLSSSSLKVEWYAVVANADFMLHDVQNEAFPEQLRERVRLFKENGRPLDFFLACEPAWLENAPGKEKLKRPAVALVSTDKVWITFMKLRLDRVLKVDVGSLTPAEAIKSTQPVPAFTPLDRAASPWTAPYSPYKPGWWEAFMADDV